MSLPIQFKEIAQLTQLGVPQTAIGFATLTMESQKYICVREEAANQENFVLVIDLDNPTRVVREKITADSAIMNPTKNILALKASPNNKKQALQVFDMGVREKLTEYVMGEIVEFWKWIDDDTLALITATTVYHWSLQGGDKKPVKIFTRLENLANNQIINYRVSQTGKWCCLIGIAKPGDRIIGTMQLHSIERNMSQVIEGHAAAFAQYKIGAEYRTLFTFASRTPTAAKLFIIEVGSDTKFDRKQTDIYFPPEAVQDFPVAMQTSDKYNVVYMLTKYGYIHIFHVGTGKLIYMNRISAETIFVTAPYVSEGGIIGVNRRGQVLSVSIDPNNVIQYICNELKDFDLALKLASDASIDCAPDLFHSQFNTLFAQQKFREAAELAASSPNGLLRTSQTIQRFQALPAIGGAPPLLIYFTVLLEKGKLNRIESLELVRPVLQQGKKELLEGWLKDDKVECSEELGDMVRSVDSLLALSIYYRAGVKDKVVSCLAQNGQYDKIVEYCQHVSFSPDYGKILTDLVVSNNRKGAFDLAMKLYKDGVKNIDELGRVVELFMSRNMLQETTSVLLDALKGDKPEEAALQTKLLEINLLQAPQVASAILAGNMFHHFNRNYIAQLCEKSGVFPRALELYSELTDRKRILMNAAAIPQEFLIPFFGTLEPNDALELLKDMMKNIRANLPVVVAIASKHSEKLTPEKLIALFESFQSFEGLYAYLGSIIDYSQDPEVHFKFIEAATRVGALKEVEKVVRDSKVYNPEKVRDFLKNARIADQMPLVIVCDLWGFVDDLTHYLYKNNMLQFIEIYVQQINPLNTHIVVGALLDDDCNEDWIKRLVMSVGICPVEDLVAAVEKRNRLRLLQPWLEARIAQGNQEPATHNAIAKLYIDINNDPEKFLQSNEFYDSRVVGKYCENRDPHLAYVAYKRGECDEELIEVTNKNSLFKDQARYLVERQSPELWSLVLKDSNESRGAVLDQVVQTALPESKNPDEVTTTVKALMNADMPKELIELLDKIILEGSEFSENGNLQNLLILTAIKADTSRVMDYINRLNNYDGVDIADIAKNNKLFEAAFQVYKKFKINHEAIDVLIRDINDLDRAQEFAENVKEPKVWSLLAGGQLKADQVKEAIENYIKANDASNFVGVITSAEKEGLWDDLVKFLNMCRKITKEPVIESELVYALAKVNKRAELEELIAGPNCAQIQLIGDRCYDEGLYEAAKVLYNNISNFGRLALTLLKLQNYTGAVEAARKANATKTWKEVNRQLVEAKEFRLAQICALHIIVHGDELEGLIREYESRGYFDEIIGVLEGGLGLERAHVGMFTELAVLYSKYRPEKLEQHLRIYSQRINIPKVLRITNQNHQWKELAYLYEAYEEWENAANTMITHPIEAWEHNKFKDIIGKVNPTETLYKAFRFYVSEHPLEVVDLLNTISQKVDQDKIVKLSREMKVLPLVQKYLVHVQDVNLKGVNEALHQLYIEEEDFTSLRHSVDKFDNFDPISLAKQLRESDLLEFRRISAYLYSKNKRWEESIAILKEDKLYKEAMKIASDSGSPDVVDSLLRFFIEKQLYECYSACLYTCYDLVKPDVAMELAWKSGITNYAMPYFIQVIKEVTTKLDRLETKEKEASKKAQSGIDVRNNVIQAQLTGMGSSDQIMIDPNQHQMSFVGDPNFYNPVVMGYPGMGQGLPPTSLSMSNSPSVYSITPPGSVGSGRNAFGL